MTREEAHKLVDQLFDNEVLAPSSLEIPEIMRKLPEGKRVVRTKSSGDRVYYIDEEKKTRQWVTNGEILGKLGFEMEDVVEIEDGELLKYNMASAIYRLDES